MDMLIHTPSQMLMNVFFICCKVQWSDLRAFLGNESRKKNAGLGNDRVCDPQSLLPKIMWCLIGKSLKIL